LPTGDVFDEARFIQSGSLVDNWFNDRGFRFQVTICEDIWAWPDRAGRSQYVENPIEKLTPKQTKNTDLVLNLSASPFYFQKHETRKYLCEKTAKKFKAPMIYANLVGAQDEIIFDGASFAVDKTGKEIIRCKSFEEDLQCVDLDRPSRAIGVTEQKNKRVKQVQKNKIDQIRAAAVLGLRDFVKKTGFRKVHLGLSGGIDSALVAALAAEAIGPENVTCIEGPFNAKESGLWAKVLSKNLNTNFQHLRINEAYEELKKSIDQQFALEKMSVVHENLQARLRNILLMAFANFHESLLLGCSNKSELACGYATLYGDLAGALLPIGDLTKTQIYELADSFNSNSEVIPSEIIQRAPTAELRPNQKDSDSLPQYSVLDQSVLKIVEHDGQTKSEIDQWLLSKLVSTEFKRWQSPPILKLSTRSFGRGRRWPIAVNYLRNPKQN
jgi:NAD+ synthase (glutamine-hydrolysing)